VALGVPAIDHLLHGRTLKDHNYRNLATPDNDTLHSMASWPYAPATSPYSEDSR
jgi:hypothetical protein